LGVVVAVLVLAGSYSYLHGLLRERRAGTHSLTFRLSASLPHPGIAIPVFAATQDDSITLVITSERSAIVHVHGYEKNIAVRSGSQAVLKLTATDAGLFPVHLHDTDGVMYPLATLEVQPK
jgi:hypothetical protein